MCSTERFFPNILIHTWLNLQVWNRIVETGKQQHLIHQNHHDSQRQRGSKAKASGLSQHFQVWTGSLGGWRLAGLLPLSLTCWLRVRALQGCRPGHHILGPAFGKSRHRPVEGPCLSCLGLPCGSSLAHHLGTQSSRDSRIPCSAGLG